VFSPEGKRYLKQQTLGDVEVVLDPSQFVRTRLFDASRHSTVIV
jgi:hypothetical protein